MAKEHNPTLIPTLKLINSAKGGATSKGLLEELGKLEIYPATDSSFLTSLSQYKKRGLIYAEREICTSCLCKRNRYYLTALGKTRLHNVVDNSMEHGS